MKSLRALHEAAKKIEADGIGGFYPAAEIVGAETALGLLVIHLRRDVGSMITCPAVPEIDEKVNEGIRREHPGLYRFVSRELASFYPNKWYALCNFSAFAVRSHGRLWPTVEHAYQAGKYTDEQVVQQIQEAPSPHEAKKRGRDPRYADTRRSDWEEFRLPYLKEVLCAKHAQHEYVRRTLERSQGMIVLEDSPDDEFFGRGRHFGGRNELGRLWMQIRDHN